VKIYTKTGDRGETGLFAGGRVPKDDQRVETYGTVDELNAILGMTRTQLADDEVGGLLQRIAGELFCLGADLATPLDAKAPWIVRIDEFMVARLEDEIDRFDAQLVPLTQFILPGGSSAGAALHVARTICRRAERRATTLSRMATINDAALRYLNRLSDWLFVVARLVNARSQQVEEKWTSPRQDA